MYSMASKPTCAYTLTRRSRPGYISFCKQRGVEVAGFGDDQFHGLRLVGVGVKRLASIDVEGVLARAEYQHDQRCDQEYERRRRGEFIRA